MNTGQIVRRKVLGDDYVDRISAATDPLTEEFQDFVTTNCWDTCWVDDRLTRRDRSLLVLAITASMGRMEEFRLHTTGAIRNGVTTDEFAALLKQVGVYAGMPAGVSAFRIVREELAAWGDGNSHTSDPSQDGHT